MDSTTETEFETSVAARVAGEDIRHGDLVTVLNEIYELPSFWWARCGDTLPADEPVRIRFMPCDAGQPFKVFSICLPFVYTERPNGGTCTFDTRKQQLVRLAPESGRPVWKRLQQKRNKKKKK